jgi:predicted MPP superfamily phosphohydrolase
VIFRILIPIVFIVLQYVMYRRASRWLDQRQLRTRWPQRLLAGAFIAFNLAFVYVSLWRPRPDEFSGWFLYLGVFPFLLWFGATFFIGFIILLGTILKLPFKASLALARVFPSSRKQIVKVQTSESFQRFDTSRRRFLQHSMVGLTAASFAGSAYGLVLGRREYEINHARFIIPNLPSQLSGFSIALVSDIHSSAYMTKKEMDAYVALVNTVDADMIAVTGDFVNSLVEEVYPFAEAFSNLRAPHGVYGVMGNHDFFTRNPELVAREIDNCGVKLIRNDKILVERDGARFYLVGVDDIGRGAVASQRIETALGYAPLQIPRILLCHRPYFLQQAAEQGIDLVLSGHTHGGQVVFGQFGDVVISPAAMASRYVWGKYEMNGTQMYVSRGIGTVGLPVRINCPAEITRIELVSSPA